MRIKTGDMVIVIAGKDKDKKGKVLKVLKESNKVIVEGVNIQTKHEKAQGPQKPGGLTKKEGPIDASNVMYFDSKAGKPSRIGYTFENGKKVRISKKTGDKIGK